MDIITVILKNLKDFFFIYLANFYGVVSSFTTFFPLSSKTFAIVPPPKDYPDVISLFATLACLFLLLYQFSQRDNKEQLLVVNKKSIFLPIVLGVSYVYVIQYMPSFSLSDFHPTIIWEWGMAVVVVAFVAIIKPIVYVAIFYSLTDLFSVLAVKEWQKYY